MARPIPPALESVAPTLLIWGAAIFSSWPPPSPPPPARAGPATLAGLLLLGGVAGVAILGPVAIRASTAVTDPEPEGAEVFVDALSEPAALTAADGRLLAANAAWTQAVGDARRLPKERGRRRPVRRPGQGAATASARRGAC